MGGQLARYGIVTVVLWVNFAPAANADQVLPKTIYPNPNTGGACVKNDGLCQTDNATRTWSTYPAVGTTGRQRINAFMSWADGLDLTTVGQPAVFTGTAETDAIYQVSPAQMPDSGSIGVTLCDDPVSQHKCDQHWIYFRYSDPSAALVCHESGHAIGLTHGTDSYPTFGDGDDLLACMQDPEFQRAANGTFGPHNNEWVNYVY